MVVHRDRPRRPTGNTLSTHVLGADAIKQLADRLREAGRSDLMAELRQGVAKAVKPLGEQIRAGVPDYVPSGYAPVLAKALTFRVTQRGLRSARSFSVSMSTIGSGSRQRRQIGLIDSGSMRHPVFGRNRYRKWRVVDGRRVRIPDPGQPTPNPWVRQTVRPGFWSEPVKDGKAAAVDRAAKAVHEVAKKVAQ